MRIRAIATTAVVSGALALTGAAMPAAQAATPAPHGVTQKAQAVRHQLAVQHTSRLAATTGPVTEGDLHVVLSNVKVGSGAFVSVGISNVVEVPYSFTVTGTGVSLSSASLDPTVYIYHGTNQVSDGFVTDIDQSVCTKETVTGTGTTAIHKSTCSGSIDIYPSVGEIYSIQAGPNYHAGIILSGLNADNTDPSAPNLLITEGITAPGLQRYSELTAHASATSVTKNHSVTVTGALTRADWDNTKYSGYTNQTAKLQFRKKGSTTYTTIKTLKTDSHGNLTATATATTSGYWRYTFAATDTTPSATATGYYVGVK